MTGKNSLGFHYHMEHINTLCGQNGQLLDAFTKLRKVTISIVMSVCPSVRMKQLGSLWTDFY
jgi:predicted RNA-binding protein Jag